MLGITLDKVGKKYNREWIFRGITHEIKPLDRLLIQGGNGSGKSTLLQIISGFVTFTEGTLVHTLGAKNIGQEVLRKHIALASPYLQVIEEFTAAELIDHLREAKPFVNNLSTPEILEIAQLTAAKNKYIRHYSSGMKQRLKLALAFLADTPLLLLDEPLSNLDKNAGLWYKQMVELYTGNRTVLVCSNAIEDEHYFCTSRLDVMDFKK